MAARLPCDLSAFNRKNEMKRTTSAENKTLVLEAFDTLFNKRDYVAAGCVRTLAVWTYEAPYAAVAAIKDHVAFYPDRVDAIDEQLAA
jgi:hypothetical protein